MEDRRVHKVSRLQLCGASFKCTLKSLINRLNDWLLWFSDWHLAVCCFGEKRFTKLFWFLKRFPVIFQCKFTLNMDQNFTSTMQNTLSSSSRSFECRNAHEEVQRIVYVSINQRVNRRKNYFDNGLHGSVNSKTFAGCGILKWRICRFSCQPWWKTLPWETKQW